MRDGLVSIITPAYRCANVVGRTIQSVLDQTYPDWELLIAEDCSPDSTREEIERWTRVDPRINLIKMERNGGPAAARNAALKQAQGRWIAFLDSDDLWPPHKLERCLAFAHEHDAAFMYTGFRRITSTGEISGRFVSVPKTLKYRQLLGNTAIATSTVMVDTCRTGEIRMRDTYYDDFDCWLRLLKPGLTAYGLNEELMHYRVMNASVSRNKAKSALKVWQAYRRLEHLGFFSSLWYFLQYAVRGFLKYL